MAESAGALFERNLAVLRETALGLPEPVGSALRDAVGLTELRERDATFLKDVSASGRTGLLLAARVVLADRLEGRISPEFVDVVARASAVTGQLPASPAVAQLVCEQTSATDPELVLPLLRLFSRTQHPHWAQWAAYGLWNHALASTFFGGSRAGRPVYLDLEDDILSAVTEELTEPWGPVKVDPLRALCRSVARTFLVEPGRGDLLSDHLTRAAEWERKSGAVGSDPPPVIAALSLFSLAAEQMRSGDGMNNSNYYGRLCELLEVSAPARRKRVEEGFRRDSLAMWDHLNAWLRAAHGARGIPTAASFNHLSYVGVPMSQALVRAADRDRLPDFFATYDLRPGQQFSRDAMMELLSVWLPKSRVTSALKSFWRSRMEARRRIAQAVCLELEHWDGGLSGAVASTHHEYRASLAASYVDVPRPAFSAIVVTRNGDWLPEGSCQLTEERVGHALLEVVEADLDFGGMVNLDYASPELGQLLDTALAGPLRLTDRTAETVITRPLRDLVVMPWDEVAGLYVESARVELGRVHLVLARAGIARDVQDALSEIAGTGVEVVRDRAGVPPGWTLFADVQVRGLWSGRDDRLAALKPWSSTQIELSGGMQLGAGRWHSLAPPSVVAVDGQHRSFAVRLFEEWVAGTGRPPVDLGTHVGTAELELAHLRLEDGDYRLVLSELGPTGSVGDQLTARALKLRSGATVHLDPPPPFRLAHCVSPGIDAWSALSAMDVADSGPGGLRGAALAGEPPRLLPAPQVALPESFGRILPANLDELFGRLAAADREDLEAEFQRLLRQGLVEIEGTKPRLTDAGQRWSDDRDRRTRAARAGADAGGATLLDRRFEADMDLILDALTAVDAGSWTLLERLIRYSSVERWEPLEAARNLSVLGYVDLELDRRTLRPRRWSLAPPALVVLPDGRSAFLSGARDTRLTERVDREVRERGGLTISHESSGRPRLWQVHGLAAVALEEVASACGLQFARAVPRHLAQSLPSIRSIYEDLPEISVPYGAVLERFDFETNRWIATNRTRETGAYRITATSTHYAILAESGLRECDHAVAKYAAAAATGRQIMAYDEAAGDLTCLLGARPPGLYERAIVLSTGELPRPLSNSTQVYSAVSGELAAWLTLRLGPAAWRTE